MWTFREVLDRLLGVVCGSVRQALRGERVVPLPGLVHNTCLLLAATVAELSAETNAAEVCKPIYAWFLCFSYFILYKSIPACSLSFWLVMVVNEYVFYKIYIARFNV